MCQDQMQRQTQRQIDTHQQLMQEIEMHHEFKGFQLQQSSSHSKMFLEQDGANCGAFASAMAVMSLTDSTYTQGKGIAHELQQHAINNSLSSIGEFFDANALSDTLNAYFTDNKLNLLAKVVDFDSPKRLDMILSNAHAKGIKVLVSFYSDDNAGPLDRSGKHVEGKAQASYMKNAHWALLDTYYQGNGQPKVTFSEGNNLSHRQYSMTELYDSNQALSDEFDWKFFMMDPANKDSQRAVQNRQTNRPDVVSDVFVEKVNLRGKIIFIGNKS